MDTDEVRKTLESKLNAILQRVPALIEQTDKINSAVSIKNLEDFVFGMIYQQYYRAIVITNVKLAHMNSDTDSNLSEFIDIGLDVFRNKSNEIRELIAKMQDGKK